MYRFYKRLWPSLLRMYGGGFYSLYQKEEEKSNVLQSRTSTSFVLKKCWRVVSIRDLTQMDGTRLTTMSIMYNPELNSDKDKDFRFSVPVPKSKSCERNTITFDLKNGFQRLRRCISSGISPKNGKNCQRTTGDLQTSITQLTERCTSTSSLVKNNNSADSPKRLSHAKHSSETVPHLKSSVRNKIEYVPKIKSTNSSAKKSPHSTKHSNNSNHGTTFPSSSPGQEQRIPVACEELNASRKETVTNYSNAINDLQEEGTEKEIEEAYINDRKASTFKPTQSKCAQVNDLQVTKTDNTGGDVNRKSESLIDNSSQTSIIIPTKVKRSETYDFQGNESTNKTEDVNVKSVSSKDENYCKTSISKPTKLKCPYCFKTFMEFRTEKDRSHKRPKSKTDTLSAGSSKTLVSKRKQIKYSPVQASQHVCHKLNRDVQICAPELIERQTSTTTLDQEMEPSSKSNKKENMNSLFFAKKGQKSLRTTRIPQENQSYHLSRFTTFESNGEQFKKFRHPFCTDTNTIPICSKHSRINNTENIKDYFNIVQCPARVGVSSSDTVDQEQKSQTNRSETCENLLPINPTANSHQRLFPRVNQNDSAPFVIQPMPNVWFSPVSQRLASNFGPQHTRASWRPAELQTPIGLPPIANAYPPPTNTYPQGTFSTIPGHVPVPVDWNRNRERQKSKRGQSKHSGSRSKRPHDTDTTESENNRSYTKPSRKCTNNDYPSKDRSRSRHKVAGSKERYSREGRRHSRDKARWKPHHREPIRNHREPRESRSRRRRLENRLHDSIHGNPQEYETVRNEIFIQQNELGETPPLTSVAGRCPGMNECQPLVRIQGETYYEEYPTNPWPHEYLYWPPENSIMQVSEYPPEQMNPPYNEN